jgi:enterobacterial common antigen flippase
MSIDSRSYREILKSSAVVGSASLVNVAVGVVRTKVMAVLLGPAGFGLMGAYLIIVELAKSVAQLGINSSGVRQIAEASGSNDLEHTSRTAAVLRVVSLGCASIGACVLWFLAPTVAQVTFGSTRLSTDVAVLSAAVFLSVIAGGQLALVQGLRRIADLSKIGILGSVLGAIASIGLVYFFRDRGIVLSLVVSAGLSALAGWWYRRKIVLPRVPLTVSQTLSESASLLKLGFSLMTSGLLALGAAYIARSLVLQYSGLESAGFYQAAWTLGGLYVGFVLQAMGTDFYPRLVMAIERRQDSNQLVNEQAQVSLLLAGPGVVATLALAPAVINLLYSTAFAGAVEPLRWICLGMALRVVTWPMGFILVAGNHRLISVCSDLAWAVFMVGVSWFLVPRFGALGAAVAFFLSYVFHGVMIYLIVRRLAGFHWSAGNLKLGSAYIVIAGAAMGAIHSLPSMWGTAIGLLAALVSGAYSLRALSKLAALDFVPGFIRRLLMPKPLKAPPHLDHGGVAPLSK